MDSFSVRLIFRLIYLTAVLVGGGYFYASVYAYQGLLVVAKGKSERTVAAPGGGGGLAAMVRPAMPPELLRASNPRALEQALDKDEVYTTAQLPFPVALEAVEVLETRPERRVIELRQHREAQQVDAAAGAVLPWGGATATVREIRPWVGLLRTPSGAPNAALSLRRGDEPWTRGVFLGEGAWRTVEGDTGLLLRWFRSDAEAKARFPESIGAFFGARWGAADRGNVNWFTSFVPGTGATLSDDTEVTLLAVEEAHDGAPAIFVSLKPKKGPEARHWYRADASTGPIRLELPGNYAQHVLINAWRDSSAYVAVYNRGKRVTMRLLAEEEALTAAEGPGFALRLDAVMRTGTPSTAITDREVLEAVLDTPTGELALREGAMHALDAGAQVRFRRLAQPPKVRYTIALGKDDQRELSLGDTVRKGNWVLGFTRETANPEQIALFDARRSAWTPGRMFGAVLIFAGCYGFVIARALIARGSQSSLSSLASLWGASPSDAGDTASDDN